MDMETPGRVGMAAGESGAWMSAAEAASAIPIISQLTGRDPRQPDRAVAVGRRAQVVDRQGRRLDRGRTQADGGPGEAD
jgi:hypothetical protein